MSLAEFLPPLLEYGEVRFRRRPTSSPADTDQARSILEEAYANHRLEIAGPLLPIDGATALSAARVVQMACWFLVNRDEPDEEVKQALHLPAPPNSAAAHLSADLVLRFATHIHRRARALR